MVNFIIHRAKNRYPLVSKLVKNGGRRFRLDTKVKQPPTKMGIWESMIGQSTTIVKMLFVLVITWAVTIPAIVGEEKIAAR